MTAVQVLIIAFVLFAVWRTVGRFRDGGVGRGMLAVWLAVWVAVGVAAILPHTTEWFARLIGVGRGVDAVIYASIIFIFYLVFRLFVRQERLEQQISLVVREAGLDKFRSDRPSASDKEGKSDD